MLLLLFFWGLCALLTCGGCKTAPLSAVPRVLDDARYQEMVIAFNARDYQRVKAELAQLQAEGIRDRRVLYLEAMIAMLEKRPDSARKALLAALKLDPQFAMAHNALGVIYLEKGRLAEAETEFIKAASNPLYATPEKAYQNLGNLYRRQERNDLAAACYQKALKFNPDYFPSHYELARLYLERQKYNKAAIHLDKAGKLSPRHPGVWLLRGRLEAALQRPRSARRAWRKVIELEPVGPFAEAARGHLEKLGPVEKQQAEKRLPGPRR